MENGLFRHRKPPRVTWVSDYGIERPPNAIICAKGLIPILKITDPEQSNIIITDVVEIGGVEDLRKKRQFYEALSLAYTHAEFQGKRIIELTRIGGGLKKDEYLTMLDICKQFRSRPNRVGKWSLACVIKVLFKLCLISKDEYDTLTQLRKIRNLLQHQTIAKYKINTEQIDRVLQDSIQVLLRMRELPIILTTKINGYGAETFWKDIGFGGLK